MPHITIKNIESTLTEAELQSFAAELADLAAERLKTPKMYFTIAYAEIPAEEWKEKVWDTEIKPHADTLLRKPEYDL